MLLDPIFIFIFLSWTVILVVNSAPIQHDRQPGVVDNVKDVFYHGIGTYYEVPGIGSCGESDTDDEFVVAVNRPQMKNGANPNQNPECEKHVEIEGDKGKKTTARIVDTCPTCERQNLDMSPKVFRTICGNLRKGQCKIKWHFKDN